MQDFTKLQVWQKAHALTLAIYHATESFPKSEQYGLTSQMRRATASIPANIAEGCGRDSQGELLRFLHIAMGSASEVEYFLILVRDLTLVDQTTYQTLAVALKEVKRMLNSFTQTVKHAKKDSTNN